MSDPTTLKPLAKLIAKHFISRPDVYARQWWDNGQGRPGWSPVNEPITMQVLLDHLAGKRSLGHYLLNKENSTTKLFAFDIDIDKKAPLPRVGGIGEIYDSFVEEPAREVWAASDPVHTCARQYLITELRIASHRLARAVRELLQQRCAVSYSGNKGLHVYGFIDEPVTADIAREGATIALDHAGFATVRGNNFFKHPEHPALTVELFPKQSDMTDKEYGNLMRLPGGVQVTGGSAFFIDERYGFAEFHQRDAIDALTNLNPLGGTLDMGPVTAVQPQPAAG